ncbi:MAG: CPBP family glutamic-type intramembrane protease [Pseudonocardia sp.]|nr:CPBP family glutamic-type intramembrane protease [Pseudonocardia sp.]
MTRSRAWALLAALVLLSVTTVAVVPRWPLAVVPWNLAVAAALLALARRSGLGWDVLGLGRRGLGRGLAVGGAAAGLVVVAYGIGLALPATRAAFDDSRAAGSVGVLLYAALLRIPFGTVVLEEVAFRAVLPGLVGGSWWRGTLVASGLFGLWHVVPSLGLSRANAAVGAAFGSWGAPAQTALAVLASALAGVAFCGLRRWGGHLVTPVLAHVATNSFGVVAAWWVT